MSKSICVVQSVEEIQFILKEVKKEVVFLPLDLSTQLYCIKNSIKFYNPLNFIKKSFHEDSLVESEKLIKCLKFGDIVMDSHRKEFKAFIRFRFHSIAFILEIIEKLKLENKVDEIIVSGWDRYFGQFSKKNIFVSYLVLNLISDIKITSLNNIDNKYTSSNEQYEFQINNCFPEKEYILLTNLGYNFFRIVLSLQKKKMNIIVPFDKKITFLKRIIYNLLKVRFFEFKKIRSNKVSEINLPKIDFMYKGKDLSKVLNSRLIQEKNNLVNLKNQSLAIDNFFKKVKIKMVITNLNKGIHGYFLDVAKKLNIASICIPHGTLSKNFDKYDKIYKETISEAITSANANFHTSQSLIAKNFFGWQNKNFRNVLNTGNLIFCEKKKNNKKNKKKILFAVTLKDFESIHMLGVEMYYEFLDNLSFLNQIAKKNSITFLIKPHPLIAEFTNDLKKEFKNLEFTNRKINYALRNVFATISFSSTVIEDSLHSNIPVILLDRWKRYKHCEAEENVKKKNSAIYYVNNENDLIDCIETIKISENILFEKYIFAGRVKNNINNLFKKLL